MRNTLKHTLFFLYITIIICLSAATIIEKYSSTAYVSTHIYGAWWFVALWALLAVSAIAWFLKRRVRRPSLVALHLSFIVILIGALLTHLTAESGIIHLRKGEVVDEYITNDRDGDVKQKKMHFSMSLTSFEVIYHEGTLAEADYVSHFTIKQGSRVTEGKVSMNNIFRYGSMRIYQASYDSDHEGSILSFNTDPYGIPFTYAGYALLFLSLFWMLTDPKGTFRRLLRSDVIRRGAIAGLLLVSGVSSALAAPVLPKETAEKFGRLNVLYDNRICPLQTLAIDFTKKIYGSDTYNSLTAEQVLTGWLLWPSEWSDEPFIKIKNGPLKDTFHLQGHTSLNSFFNREKGGYIIGPYLLEYNNGRTEKLYKQVSQIDDKIRLIMELRYGVLLKLFPYTDNGVVVWLSAAETQPEAMPAEQKAFVRNILPLTAEYCKSSNFAGVDEIATKLLKYQKVYGGASLPSKAQTTAERIYNKVPFAKLLFMLNLTIGFLSLIVAIIGLCSQERREKPFGIAFLFSFPISLATAIISLAILTACEVLRWIISGNVPMSNGYETMLFMAWVVMVLSLIVCRRFHIAIPFGLLMSGFFLLVSHIGQMDPKISHLMPVLNSPLLSVHVSIIMTAFALLSLTFICGITAILVNSSGKETASQINALQSLSLLFLYPALVALSLGIFIGAIWANISWGQYWSWDPKEVWALIALMVYAVAVHRQTIVFLRKPLNYHIFMTIAFLTILMTYFGVNYFLGGMHSYA